MALVPLGSMFSQRADLLSMVLWFSDIGGPTDRADPPSDAISR